MKIKFGSSREYRFAGTGKPIVGSKGVLRKIELGEKDAGGLLGDTKNNEKY